MMGDGGDLENDLGEENKSTKKTKSKKTKKNSKKA